MSNVDSRHSVTFIVVPGVGAYIPINAAVSPSREAEYGVVSPSNVASRYDDPCFMYFYLMMPQVQH